MKRSTLSILILFAIPLLVFAGYLLVGGDSGSDAAGSGFVHPPIASQPADGMLRAQAGAAPASGGAAGVTPTADNVSDEYYHEIFVLEEKIRSNPADTVSLAKLGRLTQDGHDFDKARDAYAAYLALHPESRQVWIDLTAVYAGLKEWEEAEATLTDMLDAFPGDERALYNLGALAANAGRMDEARDRWQTLLETVTDPALKARTQSSLKRLEEQG